MKLGSLKLNLHGSVFRNLSENYINIYLVQLSYYYRVTILFGYLDLEAYVSIQ